MILLDIITAHAETSLPLHKHTTKTKTTLFDASKVGISVNARSTWSQNMLNNSTIRLKYVALQLHMQASL